MEDKRTVKRRIGDRGEDLAARYLEQKGYFIVDRNFSCKLGELDIVAYKDDILAFVEVKTRNSLAYGRPGEFVDFKKQQRLLHTAAFYLKWHGQYRVLNPRMDVIEILLNGNKSYVNHIENAFS